MTRSLIALALLVLTGCVSSGREDGPPRDSGDFTPPPQSVATPRPEARSRYGNPPFYDQFGVRYYVLDDATGYNETGVASWYGKKFHGKRTSSGETYDMYAISAAHKTLPIPSWVRVTNLESQKSLIVRVNDRGPFVDDRIIDLSYAAANALDIINNGTGPVRVEALHFDSAGNVTEPPTPRQEPVPQQPDTSVVAANAPGLTLQTGAFSSFANAERQLTSIVDAGIENAYILHDEQRGIYRVRIDQIANSTLFDSLRQRLRQLGINQTRLVTE